MIAREAMCLRWCKGGDADQEREDEDCVSESQGLVIGLMAKFGWTLETSGRNGVSQGRCEP